jgi:V8-like Glu-specific endopeptidase
MFFSKRRASGRNRADDVHRLRGRGGIATGLVLLIVAGVAVLLLGTSVASSAGSRGPVIKSAPLPTSVPSGVTVGASRQTPAQVESYWTPQRMASAKSLDMTMSRTAARAPVAGPVTGAPGTAPAYMPANLRPNGPTNPSQGLNRAGASPTNQCYQCFIPYTRYFYYARYRTFPVSTVGKLFFTIGSGTYVCSASTNYIDTVMTAGHCVYTPGTGFNGNELFCPSYNAGVNPAVGCWAANFLVTSTVWANTGSFEWDTGGINTQASGTLINNHIGNVTGWLGLAWNQADDQNWTDFGYPQAAPFDGRFIVTCQSEFGYEDSEGNNQGGHNSLAIGCDMTGGSSGGPFVLAYGSGNWLNGHNDWKWNALPQAMNTPYYTTIECNVAVGAGRSDIGSC